MLLGIEPRVGYYAGCVSVQRAPILPPGAAKAGNRFYSSTCTYVLQTAYVRPTLRSSSAQTPE